MGQGDRTLRHLVPCTVAPGTWVPVIITRLTAWNWPSPSSTAHRHRAITEVRLVPRVLTRLAHADVGDRIIGADRGGEITCAMSG